MTLPAAAAGSANHSGGHGGTIATRASHDPPVLCGCTTPAARRPPDTVVDLEQVELFVEIMHYRELCAIQKRNIFGHLLFPHAHKQGEAVSLSWSGGARSLRNSAMPSCAATPADFLDSSSFSEPLSTPRHHRSNNFSSSHRSTPRTPSQRTCHTPHSPCGLSASSFSSSSSSSSSVSPLMTTHVWADVQAAVAGELIHFAVPDAVVQQASKWIVQQRLLLQNLLSTCPGRLFNTPAALTRAMYEDSNVSAVVADRTIPMLCLDMPDVVTMIVSNPQVDINAQSALEGNTLLHEAVIQHKIGIIEMLIALQADITVRNKKQVTALELCVELAYGDGVRAILHHADLKILRRVVSDALQSFDKVSPKTFQHFEVQNVLLNFSHE